MWRDPRQNRWQQRVNRQAKRAAERDRYLARLEMRIAAAWHCDRGPCCLSRGHDGRCVR